MSKSWYPVINYELCVECGACVGMCSHGVYNKQKAPRPVVVYPEGCVEGCAGCGDNCPNGAIEYLGDNKGIEMGNGCCCESDCDCKSGSDCGCAREE
jgi:NAD-dependent dihydropyrimidine dehydrogenase PreA subunit